MKSPSLFVPVSLLLLLLTKGCGGTEEDPQAVLARRLKKDLPESWSAGTAEQAPDLPGDKV